MGNINPVLPAPFQDRMRGDEPTPVEDADLVRELVNLDDTPRPVGDAVVVSADRDQPVMADATFELEQRVEGERRKGLQFRPLGSKGLRDDALGGVFNGGEALKFLQLCVTHAKPLAEFLEVLELHVVLGRIDLEDFSPDAAASARWTAEVLEDEPRRYLEAQGWWDEAREAALRAECSAQIDAAVQAYQNRSAASSDDMFDHLFAHPPAALQDQKRIARQYGADATH